MKLRQPTTEITYSDILGSRNIGLDLLKVLSCLVVIVIHFGNNDNMTSITKLLYTLKPYAVPMFMFASFWLLALPLRLNIKSQVVKRCLRILYPLVGWALMLFIIYTVTGFHEFRDLLEGLGWQLAIGHSRFINPPLWFLWVLLLLTVTVLSVYEKWGPKTPIILIVLSIIALFMQYSGLNERFFLPLRFELSYPLGRIAEMLPIAVAGFLAGYYNVGKIIPKNKWLILLMIIIVWQLIRVLWRFDPITEGFGYAGIYKLIIAASVSLLLIIMPIPGVMSPAIQLISRYNLGIYCLHWPVGSFLETHFQAITDLSIRGKELWLFLIIFVVCWGICFLLDKLRWSPLSKMVR